jgi:hypothetical protein
MSGTIPALKASRPWIDAPEVNCPPLQPLYPLGLSMRWLRSEVGQRRC